MAAHGHRTTQGNGAKQVHQDAYQGTRGRHTGGYPKQAPPVAPGATSPGTTTGAATGSGDATGSGGATGTHSAENYEQNQVLFEQQSQEHQAPPDQNSDQSAVTYQEENPEKADWGGDYIENWGE